ncbi:hypothetical protein DRN75_00845 [Nanoarchaeota archaeon]|nr:MAG: hypothetical protein DRN75_00845 [Nanoarchaeota archaeon]
MTTCNPEGIPFHVQKLKIVDGTTLFTLCTGQIFYERGAKSFEELEELVNNNLEDYYGKNNRE